MSEHELAARLMAEELNHNQRKTEMIQREYRDVEDKLRQSCETMSDNDRESNIHLGELQETNSQLRRGDVNALDNHIIHSTRDEYHCAH